MGFRVAVAVLGVFLALATAGGEEGGSAAAMVASLRSERAERRREALEGILLRARSLPPEEEGRVREGLVRVLEREEDASLRALAVRGLGRLGGGDSAGPLLRVLDGEEEPAPQAALVDAFADLPAESVTGELSRRAFGAPSVRVRTLAVQAAGRVPGEGALNILFALARTTHPWPVAAAVLESLSLRGDPRAVDHAVRSLRAEDPAVRAAAREAAVALLGEDLGEDPAAWEARWKESRAAWRPPSARSAPGAAGETVTVALPPPETRTVARFYDVPVTGARVVFVLDCSQSMWGPSMESARRELEAAVKGLRSSQRFGVVFFNEKVWTWREELAPATPAMKWDLVRRLPDLPTRSYTNIHDALEMAFAWAGEGRRALPRPPGLDEVFFLSDGQPNRGRLRDPERICDAVRDWNGRARVRLHTVALGEDPAALLGRLAEENGGTAVRR